MFEWFILQCHITMLVIYGKQLEPFLLWLFSFALSLVTISLKKTAQPPLIRRKITMSTLLHYEFGLSFLLTWPKSHFDLDEGFITVSKQVLGLPVVDSHHPKEQVA